MTANSINVSFYRHLPFHSFQNAEDEAVKHLKNIRRMRRIRNHNNPLPCKLPQETIAHMSAEVPQKTTAGLSRGGAAFRSALRSRKNRSWTYCLNMGRSICAGSLTTTLISTSILIGTFSKTSRPFSAGTINNGQ
jgi:hypothetical protein